MLHRLDESKRFKSSYYLKVGHSANLKHSKFSWRQHIILWKVQKLRAQCTLSTSWSRNRNDRSTTVVDMVSGVFVRSRLITNSVYTQGRICKWVTRSLEVDGLNESGPNSRVQRSIISEEARARRSSVLSKSSPRACIVRCSDSEFSLWQIFYSAVRGLTKFKTRRNLSDE